MAITDLTQLEAAHPGYRLPILKTGVNPSAGRLGSLWKKVTVPAAGANPPSGAGEVPTKATLGALPIVNPGGGAKEYLARFRAFGSSSCDLLIYDRLVHTSGLVLNSAVLQAVNSAAVSRPDASGEDVLLCLESYTNGGSTAATAVVGYTNQDGTAGRASDPVSVQSTVFAVGDMAVCPLQSGDRGVRSVQDVTLNISTGTAGNFGITLLRPLAWAMMSTRGTSLMYFKQDWLDFGLAEVLTDACLALAMAPAGSINDVQGELEFIQG